MKMGFWVQSYECDKKEQPDSYGPSRLSVGWLTPGDCPTRSYTEVHAKFCS